ncbi:anti-sigma factor family protein [Myxacorys almedinensis]|uniref:Fis family transcriptional regulator n=1 Tax=Myxacorys almedinensis A TaxID=2690445 RepID=A0A8J8CIP7_9CYAN|nr:zf-HC2 domain-containing protein [Myxacorys almedinensis]NDJ16761.1 Fis family transcriptional regulator [Myxacorys almedinensis A]
MSSQGHSESNSHGDSLHETSKDRFELLSAYLDGEVTATERRQVEEWLANDPTVQQLHARLLKLRQAFRSIPAPAPSQPVEATIDQVFANIERRPSLSVVRGGNTRRFALPMGIAAMFVGAISVFSLNRLYSPSAPQPVAVQQVEPVETGGLMVALDQPVVAMPQADSSEPGVPANKPFERDDRDAQ